MKDQLAAAQDVIVKQQTQITALEAQVERLQTELNDLHAANCVWNGQRILTLFASMQMKHNCICISAHMLHPYCHGIQYLTLDTPASYCHEDNDDDKKGNSLCED